MEKVVSLLANACLLQKMGSAFVSSFNQLSDATTTERKEQDDEERLKGVRAAIQYINGPISEALNGISISEQVEVDEILKYVSILLLCQFLESEKFSTSYAIEPFFSRPFNEIFKFLNCPYDFYQILQSLYSQKCSYVCNGIKIV